MKVGDILYIRDINQKRDDYLTETITKVGRKYVTTSGHRELTIEGLKLKGNAYGFQWAKASQAAADDEIWLEKNGWKIQQRVGWEKNVEKMKMIEAILDDRLDMGQDGAILPVKG